MVKQTGYGIASPTLEDMKLDPRNNKTRFKIWYKNLKPKLHQYT